MAVPVNRFGAIAVLDNATVATPAGGARLVDTDLYVTTTSEVYSVRGWNGGMVAVAIIVGVLTCGLGLLLLFLARREQVMTRYVETVTVAAPVLHYIERGVGGNAFVSWAKTWQAQLRASSWAPGIASPPRAPSSLPPPPGPPNL